MRHMSDEPQRIAKYLARAGVALPVFNKSVMNYAVKLGIACDCTIRERNEFARKNYFYADLPKGYQVTQDTTPICTEGFVRIKDAQGKDKRINLTRIHMEEDSGKSIHDIDPLGSKPGLGQSWWPYQPCHQSHRSDSTLARCRQ